MANVQVRYGGKSGEAFTFSTSADLIVVRTSTRMPVADAPLSSRSRAVLAGFRPALRFAEHGVEVLQLDRLRHDDARHDEARRDDARAALKQDAAVEFAGRGLVAADDGSSVVAPVVYTENLFVQFAAEVKPAAAERLLRAQGLSVKRPLPWARNGFFVGAKPGTGLAVFELADQLLARPEIELCHAELVRERRPRAAAPQQWHLGPARIDGKRITAHAHVTTAWRSSKGKGAVIAIIDDGFDLKHEELASAGKIVAPRDVTQDSDDPRPGRDDNHGTACAGVACADGRKGASGVAPAARLLPVRLASALGSMDEADAFVWAADHGADVISCSWGPADGAWWDPNDPTHNVKVPLPDSTRLAIEHASVKGRKGKGCVICFAAGNGNERIEMDGYASSPRVIAVAACNDTSHRSVYSDFGAQVWCAFPSSDFADPATQHPEPLTPGIWTTDLSGNAGYNPGGSSRRGDVAGNYTSTFGGTSSACPGVAGVVALMLARNPALTATEVRALIKQSCDRIDEAGGQYGQDGHSPLYGYGRINAAKAVKLAAAAKPKPKPTPKAKPAPKAKAKPKALTSARGRSR
jgi:subtilisin family serine protease